MAKMEKIGIVESSSKHKERYQKLFDLEEVGITIPKLIENIGEEDVIEKIEEGE